MDSMNPAEQALQLLFKKLHPHLEDAAHALKRKAPAAELLRLRLRLERARHETVEILEAASSQVETQALAEILDTLAANLTPLGENFQQSLILTQLCLEDAPKELLPFAPEGSVAGSAWGKRMVAFLAQLEDPAFQARERWKTVDPEIGDDIED
jgi:hypothetical protein